MKTILLFSNDLPLFTQLEKESRGICRINRSDSLENAVDLIELTKATIIVADIDSIPMEELDYISYLKQRFTNLHIIILAHIESLEDANRAIRSGASLYLLKPVTAQILQQTVDQLAENANLKQQNSLLEQQTLKEMMGGNPVMEKVFRLISRVAPSSATILLGGENGTGKEYFAQIIHKLSKVRGNFVPVNCGAITETLFESELFGHKKGAFTGADTDKKGLVEEADNGTLFLDEIGELPLQMQVKLLRFLQEKKFKRVGEAIERNANTRVIAASNRDLKEMVIEGTFREDLFYRLHVFPITLPPLRERKETIPNLVRIFIHRVSEKYNKFFSGFTPGVEFILSHHSYPGNIRELENIIEHAAIMAETPIITEKDLPEYLLSHRPLLEDHSSRLELPHHTSPVAYTEQQENEKPQENSFFSLQEMQTLDEVEQAYIAQILAYTDENHSEAARILGISRSTLWRKLKKES